MDTVEFESIAHLAFAVSGRSGICYARITSLYSYMEPNDWIALLISVYHEPRSDSGPIKRLIGLINCYQSGYNPQLWLTTHE